MGRAHGRQWLRCVSRDGLYFCGTLRCWFCVKSQQSLRNLFCSYLLNTNWTIPFWFSSWKSSRKYTTNATHLYLGSVNRFSVRNPIQPTANSLAAPKTWTRIGEECGPGLDGISFIHLSRIQRYVFWFNNSFLLCWYIPYLIRIWNAAGKCTLAPEESWFAVWSGETTNSCACKGRWDTFRCVDRGARGWE